MLPTATVSDEVPESQAQRIRRLESENARLGELIRKIAHDLRTPLGSILGWSEILLLKLARDPDAQRGLETIRRNAHAQAKMLDQLADARTSTAAEADDPPRPPPTMSLRAAVTPLVTVSLAGVHILVVDDELDARELLAHLFEHAGATVTGVGDVENAIRLVRTTRPDVIVSDIGMPDRDGYQLMKVVRSLPAEAGGRTPAVALTAFTRSEDRTRALLAGYQVHVAKPIEPHELLATIGSLIGRTG